MSCGENIDEGQFNTLKTSEYKYNHFFPISKEDDCLHLKFKVKAPRDAIILFSPKLFPERESPVYEIVLGGEVNTWSTIRAGQLGEGKIYARGKEALVSPTEWSEFWITIKGNKIQVGRKNESAFMEWTDSKPLSIKYFSFSCYTGASALWMFPVFKEGDFRL